MQVKILYAKSGQWARDEKVRVDGFVVYNIDTCREEMIEAYHYTNLGYVDQIVNAVLSNQDKKFLYIIQEHNFYKNPTLILAGFCVTDETITTTL